MLINLSAWLQPTHTSHLPRKEKVSLFHPLTSGCIIVRLEIRDFYIQKGLWLPCSPFPILWKSRLRQGERQRAKPQVWVLSSSVVREPFSHLRLTLCSQQAGNSLPLIMFLGQGWCQMMCRWCDCLESILLFSTHWDTGVTFHYFYHLLCPMIFMFIPTDTSFISPTVC